MLFTAGSVIQMKYKPVVVTSFGHCISMPQTLDEKDRIMIDFQCC